MKRLAPYLGIALVVAVVLLPKLRGAHVPHTEFDAAMAQAEAENKCLFLAFTGSDWCDWCVKFESEIYTRPAFKQYAASNLVVMMIDFPRHEGTKTPAQRERDSQLANRFGVQGFPTVFVLCPQGKTIAKTGYRDGGSAEYVAHIERLIADTR